MFAIFILPESREKQIDMRWQNFVYQNNYRMDYLFAEHLTTICCVCWEKSIRYNR
jgi:hypothetical protein